MNESSPSAGLPVRVSNRKFKYLIRVGRVFGSIIPVRIWLLNLILQNGGLQTSLDDVIRSGGVGGNPNNIGNLASVTGGEKSSLLQKLLSE